MHTFMVYQIIMEKLYLNQFQELNHKFAALHIAKHSLSERWPIHVHRKLYITYNWCT